MKTHKGFITVLKHNQMILVPTNTEGRSAKGVAGWAVKNAGLIYGHTEGPCGNTYCIVTKDLKQRNHPSIDPSSIVGKIAYFYEFARANKHIDFLVPYTATSDNLNGYSPLEMAEMFACIPHIPDNISFEEGFAEMVRQQLTQLNSKP